MDSTFWLKSGFFLLFFFKRRSAFLSRPHPFPACVHPRPWFQFLMQHFLNFQMNLYSGEAPLSPLTVDPLTSGGSPTLLAHGKPFPEPSLRAYSHSSHNNNRTGLEPNQSLLYSEENNSPTALNTDKSMEDKPPLMKRIAMSLNPKTMPDDEDSPLVQRNPVTGRDSRSSTHPLIDLDVIKQLNLDNRFVSPFQFLTYGEKSNRAKHQLCLYHFHRMWWSAGKHVA